MTVSSSINRASYSGNGSLTTFAYGFKVFDQDDLTVILRASNGTETVQTITTDYTVTGVGDVGGGNVVFGTAPASGVTVVILREMDLEQGLDLVPNDPFPAQSLENSLDKLTFMVQQHSEELGRTIKASRTNVISGSEFTISAADRANKVFAFDSSGDVNITQAIGVYRGDWAAAVSYAVRDIVKDTSNNNVYIANTAHTSSGTTPLSSNADIAKWDLLVDAASATSSAAAAASSATDAQTAQAAAETAQTAAETAQASAETAETNAETAETNAETAQAAAEAAQVAAELVYDNFDDRYLGAKSTSGGDPTLDNDGDALIDGALFFDTTNNVMKVYNLGTTTWLRTTPTTSDQTNINTVSGIQANVTTVAGISSDVNTVATDIANVNTNATNIASINTNATNITDIQNASANAASALASKTASEAAKDAALAALDNFDDRYLGAKASDPTLDNDGNALVSGALYFNTTDDVMKVYDGSQWLAAYASLSGALLVNNNLSDVADASASRTNLGLGTGNTPTFAGINTTGNATFGDNDKAIFGAGSDLQIYHSGSNSFVKDVGQGNLLLDTNGSLAGFTSDGVSKYMALFNKDASVDLFYNNSKKLATTSTGIDVTGTVTATSYAGDGSALTGLPAGYTDADVDTHLNTSTATADQVLSWTGSDYDWADAASGAGGGGSDEIFWENGQNVTTNYTITNGKNAMSAGPITIDSGVTVTVGAGETWTVV